MTVNRLVALVVTLLAIFMLATVVIALTQEDINWGWWWAVPLGGVFVLVVLGFRVLVQRSQEAAERADRETDQQGAREADR